MAYISDTSAQDNEEDNQLESQQEQVQLSGAMDQPSPMQAQQTGQSARQQRKPKVKKGSGRFTNIQKYIEANKPATGRLAGGIGQTLQKESQEARDATEQASQSFETEIAPARERYQGAGQFAQQTIEQAGQQPFDDSQMERFRALQEGRVEQVTPAEQRFSTAMQEAQEAKQLAGMTETEEGRFGLLDRSFSRPTEQYTSGQQRLDQLLIQATPGVSRSLQDQARQATQGVVSEAEMARDAQRQALEGLRGQAQETQQLISERIPQAVDEQEEAIRARENIRDIIQKAQMGREQLTPEELQTLGFDPEGDLRLYGVQPGEILGEAPTLSQLASQEEAARYQALQQLAGSPIGELPINVEEAGQYDYEQRLQDLQEAIATGRQEYTTEQERLQGEISPYRQYAREYTGGYHRIPKGAVDPQDLRTLYDQLRGDTSWLNTSRYGGHSFLGQSNLKGDVARTGAELEKELRRLEDIYGGRYTPLTE